MTTNLKQLCTGSESISGWSRREFLNRFGMGLGGLLERLVVGQRVEVVLVPLGIDPAEHIADEGSVVGP